MRTPVALLALLAPMALTSCIVVSGADCVKAIPEELRADAIRYAIDREIVREIEIPESDFQLGMVSGRPYKSLTPERRTQLAPYVATYADCVHERIIR